MVRQSCQPKSSAKQPPAVAVHHRGQNACSPPVTAKGEGALAEQILAIAFDRGVKGYSDADPAAALKAVDVEPEVPLAALAAMAEILSYALRASATQSAAPRARPQRPSPTGPAHASAPAGGHSASGDQLRSLEAVYIKRSL